MLVKTGSYDSKLSSVAPMVALQSPECASMRLITQDTTPTIEAHDSDPSRAIAAWPNLPQAVKAAVLAIIGSYERLPH